MTALRRRTHSHSTIWSRWGKLELHRGAQRKKGESCGKMRNFRLSRSIRGFVGSRFSETAVPFGRRHGTCPVAADSNRVDKFFTFSPRAWLGLLSWAEEENDDGKETRAPSLVHLTAVLAGLAWKTSPICGGGVWKNWVVGGKAVVVIASAGAARKSCVAGLFCGVVVSRLVCVCIRYLLWFPFCFFSMRALSRKYVLLLAVCWSIGPRLLDCVVSVSDDQPQRRRKVAIKKIKYWKSNNLPRSSARRRRNMAKYVRRIRMCHRLERRSSPFLLVQVCFRMNLFKFVYFYNFTCSMKLKVVVLLVKITC